MRKYFRPFCATFLAVCVVYITSVSVFADDNGTSSGTEYVQKSSFFHMFAGTVFSRKVIGYAFDGMVCPNTEDGYHRATSYEEYKKPLIGDPYYSCICEHCGHTFKAYETDLKQSYETQVSEMPATGYNSEGRLIWNPFADFDGTGKYYFNSSYLSITQLPHSLSGGSCENDR